MISPGLRGFGYRAGGGEFGSQGFDVVVLNVNRICCGSKFVVAECELFTICGIILSFMEVYIFLGF